MCVATNLRCEWTLEKITSPTANRLQERTMSPDSRADKSSKSVLKHSQKKAASAFCRCSLFQYLILYKVDALISTPQLFPSRFNSTSPVLSSCSEFSRRLPLKILPLSQLNVFVSPGFRIVETPCP